MRKMNDIAVDNTGDLLIVNGDFAIVESTAEHQRSILLDNVGDYPYDPLNCVGAVNYLDDEGADKIINAIAKKFMQDGMEVKQMNPNPISVADSTAKPFENAYYP